MCGVPFHNAQNYIARLLRAGRKVAIAEQLEAPSKAMQDVVPNQLMTGFGNVKYGFFQKAVSRALYGLFFLNSRTYGCQLFLLAEKQ